MDTRPIVDKFINELPECEILAIAGDLTQGVEQMEPFLKMLRLTLPDTDIAVVMGNHDFWDSGVTTGAFFDALVYIQKLFKDYDIYDLNDACMVLDDIIMYGFNGWYCATDPPTNDRFYMPPKIENVPMNDYMYHRAVESVGMIIDSVRELDDAEKKTKIIMTHFNLDDTELGGGSMWLQSLSDEFDILLEGHTHRELETSDCGIKRYNAGSDYGFPKYKLVKTKD